MIIKLNSKVSNASAKSISTSESAINDLSVPSQDTQANIAVLNDNIACIKASNESSVSSQDTQSTIVKLKDAMTYSEARNYLDDLYRQRLSWEADQYRTSCTRLYEILCECYRIARHVDINNENSPLRRCVEDQCKRKMLKVLSTTTVEAKIVRSVFENLKNRRRVSVYANVLRKAVLEKISIDQFIEWIELSGGIEEIVVKGRVTNEKPAVEKKTKSRRLTEKEKEEQIIAGRENFERLVKAGIFSYGEEDEAAATKDVDISVCEDKNIDSSSDNLDVAQVIEQVASNDSCYDTVKGSAITDSSSMSTMVNTVKQSDELVVCLARKTSNNLAEIVWTVTDEVISRLVQEEYARSVYGDSETLDLLKKELIDRLVA